ncbi:MAG TPA: sulfotransferase [Chloroflexi bacterium]|nr:sulfotransferase [Chloroflexota bacterium]
MSDSLKPPVILLGNTRSGTSMVQNVMGAHPEIAAWYEPTELWLCADPLRPHDEFTAADATPRVRAYIRRRFLAYQRAHGGRRVLEKTPRNIFKIPYVRAIFPEACYLYIVRSPFSFISSVEFKWQQPVTGQGIRRRLKAAPPSQLPVHFARWLSQQVNKRLLRRKYLSIWGPRYAGIQEDVRTLDRLTVIARQWAYGSRQAEQALAEFPPGQVLRMRYEDFVADPLAYVERICAHCGLDMHPAVAQAAREMVHADRQNKWRRLDPADLARVLPEIEEEMIRHGYEIPAEIAALAGRQPAGEGA